MPIKIDGKDYKGYETYKPLEALIPRGKNKTVTFAYINQQPYKVLTDTGLKDKVGGEKSISTTCTTRIPLDGVMQDVVVTYYKTSTKKNFNGSIIEDLAPHRISFPGKRILVNAVKEKDLLFFLYVNNKCENPDAQNMTPPVYRVVKTQTESKPKVKHINDKVAAINAIQNLKETSKNKLQQLYQHFGFTDWDDLVGSRYETENDWDTVMARLYERAERRPTEVMEAINDTLLNVSAKVTMGLANNVIAYEKGKFVWGKNNGNELLEHQPIKAVPKSSQVSDEIAVKWFVEWLKTDKEGIQELQELTTALDNFEKKAAAN